MVSNHLTHLLSLKDNRMTQLITSLQLYLQGKFCFAMDLINYCSMVDTGSD